MESCVGTFQKCWSYKWGTIELILPICVCANAVNSEFLCVQFLRGIQNDRQICEIELLWLFSIVQYSRRDLGNWY
jgi:hypothetical protein